MIPAGMTVGRLLQKTREEKNIPLESIARETRIKLDFLQAIEEDSFQVIPCEAYVRGFIRCYAKFLHLNPEEMIDRFNHQVESQRAHPPDRPNGAHSLNKSLHQAKNHLFDFLTTLAGGTAAYPLSKTILRSKD